KKVEAKPKVAAKKKVAAKNPPVKKKVPAGKAAVKKRVPKAFTEDEIRITAFYVYEERSATGSPGNPAGDWNEAIRRLKARDRK
ncbi:MAG: hypothetical protein P8J87_20075, partial [Verrucomicrobiales bacterium]|nr:hypothetical protein [Verrucomicrobiales bacterium]